MMRAREVRIVSGRLTALLVGSRRPKTASCAVLHQTSQVKQRQDFLIKHCKVIVLVRLRPKFHY